MKSKIWRVTLGHAKYWGESPTYDIRASDFSEAGRKALKHHVSGNVSGFNVVAVELLSEVDVE